MNSLESRDRCILKDDVCSTTTEPSRRNQEYKSAHHVALKRKRVLSNISIGELALSTSKLTHNQMERTESSTEAEHVSHAFVPCAVAQTATVVGTTSACSDTPHPRTCIASAQKSARRDQGPSGGDLLEWLDDVLPVAPKPSVLTTHPQHPGSNSHDDTSVTVCADGALPRPVSLTHPPRQWPSSSSCCPSACATLTGLAVGSVPVSAASSAIPSPTNRKAIFEPPSKANRWHRKKPYSFQQEARDSSGSASCDFSSASDQSHEEEGDWGWFIEDTETEE